jgi:hypothetical protein
MVSRGRPIVSPVNGCCALIWLSFLGAVFYGIARGHALTSLPVAAPLVMLAAFSLAAARPATRLFGCVTVVTLLTPFYMFEVYLMFRNLPKSMADMSKVAYVTKLRHQGFSAYPAVFPSGFRDLWQNDRERSRSPIVFDGRDVLPLAGVPDVLTVYCPTPDLDWVTYHSDEFGFRNPAPAGLTTLPEFALLGDSFVQGFCVPDRFTYRSQLSALGPTVSYGVNGTSALTQLAIYREYIKQLKPHHLIWFFYEGNDLADYVAERTWPALRAYLEPTYTQDLVRLNGTISVALKHLIDQELTSKEVAAVAHDSSTDRGLLDLASDFWLLRRTRTLLALMWRQPRPDLAMLPSLTEADWQSISRVWREVIDSQHAQGGQITFVYIPAHWRFFAADPAPFTALEHRVVSLWLSLGVDYLSLSKAVEGSKSPLAYYDSTSFYEGIHFNTDGYELTGQAIIAHLRRPVNRRDADGRGAKDKRGRRRRSLPGRRRPAARTR